MIKKTVLWLTILVILARWPLSWAFNPPKLETGLIWQMGDAQEENRLRIEKLGLDTSRVKRVFYNKVSTVVFDRFTKNVLALLNINSYFFDNFPSASVSDADTRAKFPYPAIIGFLVGVYLSIQQERYLKLWLLAGVSIALLSLFKQADCWNVVLYPILGVFTLDGLKAINKYTFCWLLLLVIASLGLTEIGRIHP